MIDIIAVAALIAMVVLAYRTNSLRLRIIVLTALLVIYLGRELTAFFIANYSIPTGTVDKLYSLQLTSGAKDVLWPNVSYAGYEMLMMIGLYVLCVWGFVRENASRQGN